MTALTTDTATPIVPGMPDVKTITPRDAAGILGINMPLVYAWIDQGKLEATKDGSRIDVHLDSVERVAKELETPVKRGRPKVVPAELSKRTMVRSSEADAKAWAKRAASQGFEVGTWLRRIANEACGRPNPVVGPGARRKLPRPRSRG